MGGDSLLELKNLMLAIVKVSNWFPGSFVKGIAFPLDQVVFDVVDSASLQNLLYFPFLWVFHNKANKPN